MKNSLGINIILDNEQQRLEALRRYQIAGTPAEKAFTSIAKLVSDIFNCSIAMISLVDDEVVYFAANVGMDTVEGPRGNSFCSLTVLQAEVNVIEDALYEPNVNKNPLVCSEFGLRFYAGAPLITHDGFRIGTVCLVDTQPRKFTDHDREILQGMAGIVMEQIELHLINLQEAEKQKAINKQSLGREQWFQNVLDTMAEGVGIIDTTGQLVYANTMAQRILGLKLSEIKGRTFDDPRWQNLRINGTPLPDEEHPMAIMMRTGMAVYDHEIAVQPPDKERFYISINAAPIMDPETGKITGGIGTFMDVTNRRKVMQQKDEFISVASHELKTPVTSLKASLQLLERMRDNPKPELMSKLILQSNKSLHKLTGLINDLLNSSRISEGQLHLRKTEFTIADMITDCCHHIHTAGKHDIELKGNIGLKIFADEQQIDQVVVNLVNNAVKYAPESKHISIDVEQVNKKVKISVKDEGPGIEPEKIPHLFDRYYRADYSGIQFSGLGLGLYISAEIIKKHGGEIGVESELGNGSTFWFTLPLGK
jgi:PAS domain S-box-containing protein